MTKLSEKARGEVKDLLDDYQKICDMLQDASKRQFLVHLTGYSEDGDDIDELLVRTSAAVELLKAEKQWTEDELKKLGIEV